MIIESTTNSEKHMSMEKRRRIKGIIVQIIAEVMFGFSFMFTKGATSRATPLQLLSWRFMTAAILFFILALLGVFKVNYRGKDLKAVLLLGFLHPICYFLCENKGIALTSASESGTIIATIPIFALLVSSLFLHIKPGRNQMLGIFITISGVLILVLSQGSKPTFDPVGYLLLFGAVIAYSFYAAQSTRIAEFTSVEKAGIMIFSGAVFFTITDIITEFISGDLRHFLLLPLSGSSFLSAVLYLGIGSSIIAFTCNNYGIEVLGTTASSSFAALSTLVSVLAGIIFLKEPFTYLQGIATILIISGVFITNRVSD